MNINIISTKEEKLWSRKEITFSVETNNKTVSKDDAKVELCKKLNLNPDSTIITQIKQGFGNKSNLCYAHAYLKKEDLRRFEPKYFIKRIEKKSGTATADEGQNAKPEEKPKAVAKEKAKKKEDAPAAE